MDDFDLDAACLVRLRQDLEALLANVDTACRERIIALFSIRPRDGLEAIPQLRALLSPRPRAWPWPAPARENDARPVSDAEWEVEALPEQPRATLWPYRPKREPDELVSSWLWRIARGLGAPPKRFVLDAMDLARSTSTGRSAIPRSIGWPSCPASPANIFWAAPCVPISRCVLATGKSGFNGRCSATVISC
jgi:hypothetical protein